MRLLFILCGIVLCTSCADNYKTYKITPEYITRAPATKAAFFKAYDETLKLWKVDYDELYIPTSKGTAHVIVSGPKKGEPVVLLHGMNASSTMWYPNIQSLSKNHRVFAIDFILEPNKSLLTHDIERLEGVSDWYEEVLQVLELKRYHLIGASRGGWMAVQLALNNKKQVQSITLLSPAQTFIWIRPSVDLFKNITALFSSKEKQIEQTLESMSVNAAKISDVYIKQYKLGLELVDENKFVSSMQPYSNEELQSLQMPVLVLIGDDDMINEQKTVEMANTLPQGKGEVIKNAGHFLSIDQAEVVNEKIVAFLKEHRNGE